MKQSRITTGQIKTTPKPFTHNGKTDGPKPKVSSKKMKTVKVSRKSLPNIKGTEGQAKGKGGMNDENALRKQQRLNQGL